MSITKADVAKKSAELEAKLKGKLFLGGTTPSADDVKAFEDLLGKGNLNLYRWCKNIASFTEAERKAWGAPTKPETMPNVNAAYGMTIERRTPTPHERHKNLLS